MSYLHGLRRTLRFGNSIQILVNRTLFPSRGVVSYKHGELDFLVDHDAGDQDGPRACVEPGLYDPFLAATDLAGEIRVLDLGAQAGGFLLALRKAGLGIAKGVCVELHHTWSRLVYNAYRNVPGAHERLELLNGAVAPDEGELRVRLGRGGVGNSVAGEAGGAEYRLPKFPLEALVGRFESGEIDLLKIDVEGMEHEFASLPPELLRGVRWLIVEIHGEDPPDSPLRRWIARGGLKPEDPASSPIESNVFLFHNQLQ